MKRITKISYIVLLIIAVVLCTLFSACSANSTDDGRNVCKIVIADNEAFTVDAKVKSVARGDNALFHLTFKNGYSFGSLDYGDFDIQLNAADENGTRSAILMLKSVKYSAYLEIRTVVVDKLEKIELTGSNYICDTAVKQAPAGDDLSFELIVDKGYALSFVRYSGDYTVTDEGDKQTITLSDIQNSEKVEVVTNAAHEIESLPDSHAFITYNANGGGTSYVKAYTQRSGFRTNTDTGTNKLSRDGFVLCGWNTSASGSGKHIGLGSRSDVKKGERQQLYAEWQQEAAISNFSYKYIERKAFEQFLSAIADGDAMTNDLSALLSDEQAGNEYVILTSYVGNAETLTIPQYIGGIPVIGIEMGTVSGSAALKTLVLPPSIRYIAHTAFNNCQNLKEMYIYDNIDYVNTYAFGISDQYVETLHINALLPPVYSDSENGQFSNKIDLLIKHNSTKSKLICFGSCSTWYGLNAKDVTTAFSNRLTAYNMGIIGGANTHFQIDIILEYTNKNDVFVFNTELGSDSHMLCINYFDRRVFTMVEGNYDLLAALNMKNYGEVWTSFSKYVSGKRVVMDSGDYTEKGYDVKIDFMNEYGDMIKERPGSYDNAGSPYEFLSLEYLRGYDAVGKLHSYYEKFFALGVKNFFGYGPMNEQGLETTGALYDYYDAFFREGFSGISSPVTPFMSISSCVLPSKYFYDANYHLSTSGAIIYTNYFINQLKLYI